MPVWAGNGHVGRGDGTKKHEIALITMKYSEMTEEQREKRRQFSRDWKKRNREKVNAGNRDWARRNPDKTAAYHLKYRKANPEKVAVADKIRKKIYYENNKAKCLKLSAAWSKANPERNREKARLSWRRKHGKEATP